MPKTRKKGNKKLGRRLHVFCEGEKTEPLYLTGFAQSIPRVLKKLRIVEIAKTKKNTPVQLVDEAVKLKKKPEIPDGDLFWVVYDRENVSKYSDQLHAQAFNKAKDNGINLAISNVCFEVWILLHFQKTGRPFANFDQIKADKGFITHLASIGIENYDKGNPGIFDSLADKVETAKANAKLMNQSAIDSSVKGADKPYQLNPYTGVVNLIEAIEEFLNKK